MRALLGVQRLASLRPGLAPRQQLRFMGAPKGGGGYGHGEYRGLKVPPVADYHKNVATVWGCMMWLWIFWRVKNDGKALIVRPPATPAAPTREGAGACDPSAPPAPAHASCAPSAPSALLAQGLEHPWDHGHGHGDDHGHH